MFKIEFYVDDKHVAPLLHLITGKVLNLSVVPVVNAVKTEGKSKANGSIKQDAEHTIGLFCKELKKIAKDDINAENARQALSNVGLSPTSYSYFLSKAVDAGLIKKGKREGNNFNWSWV